MRPETSALWEQALSHFSNVTKLEKDKEREEAAREAIKGLLAAILAMTNLSDDLGMPGLKEIACNAFLECFERRGHWGPKETIEWARRTLKRLSDGLPPDTFRPLR